jgi:hypothetical protein
VPQSTDGRVFDWLGKDAKGTPYHLHPLNLVWSDAGAEHDLGVYRRVAERLAADTAYWSAIIRDTNWRYSLVGCVCLLVSRNRGFFDELLMRFEAGSMVIPQIAATMGLLHPSEARAAFELALATPRLRDHPQRRVSAERALVCLGVHQESEVMLHGWSILDRDDAVLADRVVQQHWDFWSRELSRSSGVQ